MRGHLPLYPVPLYPQGLVLLGQSSLKAVLMLAVLLIAGAATAQAATCSKEGLFGASTWPLEEEHLYNQACEAQYLEDHYPSVCSKLFRGKTAHDPFTLHTLREGAEYS